MNRNNFEKDKFENDDYSRFAGPEYLDRVSLSRGYEHYYPSGIGKGPKNYKRSDSRIYDDICEALYNDSHVDASDIEVEVNNGLVTLRGVVDDRVMKKEAEFCIENISGV